MSPTIDYFGYGFAILVAFGGVMGYMRKGSLPSLLMGVSTGIVIGIAAHQKNATLGASVCASLAFFMGYRFFHSGSFMPAGFVSGLSVAMAIRYIYKLAS
jgi:uncharacterized membrane protein (UPF0136 family)